MGEMREWWANVYVKGAMPMALRWGTREEAIRATAAPVVCRIHVRLKPEGAPRRYVDSGHRRAWECFAERALIAEALGHRLTFRDGDYGPLEIPWASPSA